MKGKRYTTEDKVRILREADRGGKSIQELCREENTSGGEFPSVEAAVWVDGPQPSLRTNTPSGSEKWTRSRLLGIKWVERR